MTPEQQKAEAERVAHDNAVKVAEKDLADKQAARLAAAKPVITAFNGYLKGPFVIEGENLGRMKANDVSINGHTAVVTAIRANNIKGTVPVDVQRGDVAVKVGEATFTAKISA